MRRDPIQTYRDKLCAAIRKLGNEYIFFQRKCVRPWTSSSAY